MSSEASSNDASVPDDPIVAEVRRVREEYAAKFNYDLDGIYSDLKRQQQESGRQYVTYPPKRIKRDQGET